MLPSINECLSQKTISQYKVIEDRYHSLRRFICMWFDNHETMEKADAELIVKAIDHEPINLSYLYNYVSDEDENEEI